VVNHYEHAMKARDVMTSPVITIKRTARLGRLPSFP
jgi:hypothetical protein